MMLSNNDVEDLFRHHRENDHHQRADDCATEHAERERRITLQVSKNTPDYFQPRRAIRRIIRTCRVTAVKSAHSLTYTRSPGCLYRSLNVSSAIPDLSSSPRPGAIMRSYCSFVARASGKSRSSCRASS